MLPVHLESDRLSSLSQGLSMDWLVESARRYQFTLSLTGGLCQWTGWWSQSDVTSSP